MYLLVSCFLPCLSFAQGANILGVFMFPSISHQVVYQQIWRELSLRGHSVTVVTPDPLNDPSLTNLTEISVRFAYEIFEKRKLQDAIPKHLRVFQYVIGILQILDLVTETELKSPAFQKLIQDKNQHFDLVLVESFHPVMYGLAGRFQAPAISVSSFTVAGTGYDVVGNPNHPILHPDLFLNLHERNLSFWQTVQSVAFHLWFKYYHRYRFLPRTDVTVKRYIGDGIPYIGDLETTMSMLFLNMDPLIYPPNPNVPAVMEMGQMHLQPVKPLPQDLQLVLDEATEGVVLFSLGSVVKSVNLDDTLRNVIIQALGELPYKVLWKWENDDLPGKPPNVIIRKWFPQQDLLAHPNLRVFVTQGGLQSMEEAISRGIPLVGMPFLADQPMNVGKIVELGIGVALDPSTVTKKQLKMSIMEVAQNDSYRRRIQEVRNLLDDKPMSGLEKAVWWVEYVIRHRGARHLRSPRVDISYFEYLLLDVGLLVVVTAGIVTYGGYRIAQVCVRRL